MIYAARKERQDWESRDLRHNQEVFNLCQKLTPTQLAERERLGLPICGIVIEFPKPDSNNSK